MFQITEFTEAHVASVTNRVEKHGEDEKPAVSLGLEITAANTLLDLIDPKLRHALYEAVEGQDQLPGVEPATPLLRCHSFDTHTLTTSHEGWTLAVDDGIDDTQPMIFGGAKVDKFKVEAKQGGSIVLRFRVGTSDVDADKLGKLAMHNGQSVWITLKAPEKKQEAIDGSVAAFEADHPPVGEGDATDLFTQTHDAAGAGDPDSDEDEDSEGGATDLEERLDNALARADAECRAEGWPFPGNGDAPAEAAPQSVTVEPVIDTGSKRTARGRDRTKAALAAGLAAHSQATQEIGAASDAAQAHIAAMAAQRAEA